MFLISLGALVAAERPARALSDAEWKETVNGGTVRIITKGLGCTCTAVASDMARVLNEMGELRILPVLGHGSLQGIADVLYLKGIDLSILQSDALAYVKRNGTHPNIDNKVRFVTRLYNSELHLLVSRDIKTIADLHGKTVNFDVKGRGSAITAQNVFDALGIVTKRVNLERDVAIEKLRSGELAASFVVTGKPASSMRKVAPGDGLHFLPIPFSAKLLDTYVPSKLTHADYPKLIPKGQEVPTIAVAEVLAVYNWQPDSLRYKKLTRFVNALFNNIGKFHEPVRHPKWKNVNIAAAVPGWQRFRPAQQWLDENIPRSGARTVSELRHQFRQFMAQSRHASGAGTREADSRNMEQMFQSYLRWARSRR